MHAVNVLKFEQRAIQILCVLMNPTHSPKGVSTQKGVTT